MPAKYPGPAYRIVTPRLVIRCYEPKDAPLLKTAVDKNVEHLKTFLPWAAGHPQDLQNHLDLLRSFRGKFDLGQDYIYGVFTSDESRLLGGTGLHMRLGNNAREIGYWIDKDCTGQGFATEVSAVLTQVAFDIDMVDRVEIHCAIENLASAAVPRKLGYTHEATLRQRNQLLDGHYHDAMIWSILRAEYPDGLRMHVPYEAFDTMGRPLV